MKSYRYFCIILLSLIFTVCEKGNAQAPDWAWAKSVGASGDDFIRSIAVDTLGNVYSTGTFQGSVDFDPGQGVFNLTSNGLSDSFISKIDSAGNFIWAKAIIGISNSISQSIALDKFGNVFITGSFEGTIDFDPGLGVFNLTSNGLSDEFICKLDNSGNFIWAKAVGGINDDGSNSITIDVSGNILTTGDFSGTVDFDPSIGIFNLTSFGEYDIFVSKFDSGGNFVWAKRFGGTDYDYSISIVTDVRGNVYTTGFFTGTCDFDPDTSVTFNLTSSLGLGTFISKLDSLGNFVWAKVISGDDYIEVEAINLDKSGNVYITGGFWGTADFDPGVGIFNLTSIGVNDIFLCKLDNSGNFDWAFSLGFGYGATIANDDFGNVYTSGWFKGTMDFDPDSIGNFSLTSAGSADFFISKMDSVGNFIWAKALGDIGADGSKDIALDVLGNVYVTGNYRSHSMVVGQTILTNSNNISDSSDFFLAKLGNTITGIQSINNLQTISLYPNPTNNLLTISYPSLNKKASITITDIAGKIIYQTNTASSLKTEINTKDFSAGVYLVQIQSDDFVETRKVIVGR